MQVCVVLCPLAGWDAAGLIKEGGAEMKALLMAAACPSLPSQHYPLSQRREAGPVLPTVCTREEEISQR